MADIPETFEPQANKFIYGYVDGSGKKVYADPQIILGKLSCGALTRGKSIDELIEKANPAVVGKAALSVMDAPAQVESWNAMAMLDEISREAFGLTQFNPETGEGADMAHALGVLNHFHLWCEKKNQTPAPRSTSTPSVESTPGTQATTGTSSV